MARAPLSTESSRVYVGMLLLACTAMVVGIAVLVLEGGEYDWVQKPPSSPVVQLPSNAPPPPSGTTSTAEPAKVAEAPTPVLAPAVVPVPPPVVVAESPKPAEPKPLELKPAEPAVLVAPPVGPIPSPLIIPGR